MTNGDGERQPGFYWINGHEGWEPWKWTPKGWTNDYVSSYYTDEEIGEIGPFIPFPDTTQPASTALVEWKVVPDEITTELLAAATKGRQVLAYENGRYYNAWLEFEQSEGGWIWFDEADSEPNPSHYCELPPEPALSASQSTSRENADA